MSRDIGLWSTIGLKRASRLGVMLGLAAVMAGCSVEELSKRVEDVRVEVLNDPLANRQPNYYAIGINNAWQQTTGTRNVRIAIIDSGRAPHEDLNGKLAPIEYDAVRQDGSALSPNVSHSSHVAAIAAGSTNNGLGGAGVCWECQILHVDIMGGNGKPDLSSLPRAIRWSVENGARVINMSFATDPTHTLPCSDPEYDELRAALAFARSSNVSVVAAAGNYSVDIATTVPASCPDVISVAATDETGALASYSNFGAVTLAAPGGGGTFAMPNVGFGASIGCPADGGSNFTTDTVGIVSAWTTSNGTPCYRYLSGTSMAAPHIAGIIGLMLSRNPNLTPERIKDLLRFTVRNFPCNRNCGFGIVDAFAAVRNSAPSYRQDAPPVPQFTYTCDGLSCVFDGNASYDQQSLVAHQWILPGGQLRDGAEVSFFLPGFGTHEVRLRVTDDIGQSQELVKTVTVSGTPVTPRPGSYVMDDQDGPSIELYETTNGNWVLGWFTFERVGAQSEPVWYNSAVGAMVNGRFQQPLYRYTWVAPGVVPTQTQVGTITLDFPGSQIAWVSWVLNGRAGGARYQFQRGGEGRSGLWYAPHEPGWGIAVQESGGILSARVTFYDVQNQPRWMAGSTGPNANAVMLLQYLRGEGLCPSCGGKGSATADSLWSSPQQPSSLTLRISDGSVSHGSSDTGIYVYTQTGMSPVWVKPMYGIQLLTKP